MLRPFAVVRELAHRGQLGATARRSGCPGRGWAFLIAGQRARRFSVIAARPMSAIPAIASPQGDSVGAPAGAISRHSPARPGSLQVWPGSSQGVSQQTPVTQKVEAHCAGVVHPPPFGTSGVCVGVALTVLVSVMVAVAVCVAVPDAVVVAVAVAVCVTVPDAVAVTVCVAVPVAVAVAVAVATGGSHVPIGVPVHIPFAVNVPAHCVAVTLSWQVMDIWQQPVGVLPAEASFGRTAISEAAKSRARIGARIPGVSRSFPLSRGFYHLRPGDGSVDRFSPTSCALLAGTSTAARARRQT